MKRLLIICLLLGLTSPIARASDGYALANGSTTDINAHGVCRRVTNWSGANQYVPVNAAAEWSSFYNTSHAGVTIAGCTCNLPWGGTIADGGTVTAYSTGFNTNNCASIAETRTCSGPTLTGSYTFDTCLEAQFKDSGSTGGGQSPSFGSIALGPVATGGFPARLA